MIVPITYSYTLAVQVLFTMLKGQRALHAHIPPQAIQGCEVVIVGVIRGRVTFWELWGTSAVAFHGDTAATLSSLQAVGELAWNSCLHSTHCSTRNLTQE